MTGSFSPTEQRELAGRARTLHERLMGPPNEPGEEPPFGPDDLLAEWRDLFPDESAFADRLEREGISESAVLEQAAATRWPADRRLPEWIDELEALVEHVESGVSTGRTVTVEGTGASGQVELSADVPFAHLIARIVEGAWKWLPGTVPDDVVTPMVEGLATRVGSLTTRALYVEFKSFVLHHDPDLARADPDEFDDPPAELYDAFVEAMVEQGVRNLCLEYPVLARQLVTVLTQWVETVEELYQRVETDHDAVTERFDVEGRVTALEPLADDTHAEGRVPVRVEFSSGAVVYKPRPVDAGIALHELLDSLDEHLPWSSLRHPRYLTRDEYGWMEFVEYRNPNDETGVERFYERAGLLVCVAYVLHANDWQFENLIVDGERPAVLDAETTFHPHVSPATTVLATEVTTAMADSVLFTSMLPRLIGDPATPDADADASPVAGFADETGEVEISGYSTPSVRAVNTDVMAVEMAVPTVDRTTNVPVVGGEAYPSGEYVEEIVCGFERTYETIRERHVDGQFVPTIERACAEEIETRFVYRGTQQYASVLRSAAGREPLRDGVRLTVEFERLAVPFFDGRIESDRYWPLYAAERESLRRRDVPRFTATVAETELFHDGRPLHLTAGKSGYDRCRQRLDAMDDADRRRQAQLIRWSFGNVEEGEREHQQAKGTGSDMPATGDGRSVTDGRLLREAVDLGTDVIDAAVDERESRWVSFGVTEDVSAVTLLPAGHSLYNGRAGIGLTFAALSQATGQQRFRETAVETLDAVAASVESDPESLGLGGTAGIGSVIYALTVAGDLLDRPRYGQLASAFAEELTDDRVAADETLDVMGGAAGTLLALLAHYDRHGDDGVLERALVCGERLLAARDPVGDHRMWQIDGKTLSPGFAHGTSGIAYALARLAAAANTTEHENAAREVLEYESTLYDPGRVNWADPNAAADETYLDRWCHGRTGIALARIGIAAHLEDQTLLADTAATVRATDAGGPGPVDTVCCGNFGRATVMLEAARKADSGVADQSGPEAADARVFVGRCLDRKERNGTFAIPGHSAELTDPTFFDGVSGIAYVLARLRNPDDIPCVLLLE